MEEMNRFKIAKRITPFINTFFTEKWDVEKLIKILPPKEKVEKTKEMDEVTLVEAVFDTQEQKRAKESYENDEDEDRQGGGVQCGQQ